MTATVITPTTITSPWATISAGDADFTFVAGTITDGDKFTCTGRDIVLFYNSGLSSRTITFTSSDDNQNRTEDLTYTLGAGEYCAWCGGLTNAKGWQASDRTITFTVSNAEVVARVLRLPSGYPGS